MNDIETFILARRLAKYAKPTAKEAFAAHLYNSELAESFYQSLSYFEIILRNKIDAVFSKHLGENWIFNPAYLIGKNADTFQKIRKRLSAEAQKDPNNKDHLISELTFGFWAYLFFLRLQESVMEQASDLVEGNLRLHKGNACFRARLRTCQQNTYV